MMFIHFSSDPMLIGETRRLTVAGEGPFDIVAYATLRVPSLQRQFVGEAKGITSGRSIEVDADNDVWKDRSGILELEVSDSQGQRRKLHVNVHPRDTVISKRVLAYA